MLNVNQITAQLARMPDQALQRYAQMNKGDPYILALALSESNRRKQMRDGAQMAAPEQPKVVDQAIAGMAAPMPEDVGIGQLPVGEMEFAAGGIVAFDEGGKVPRYQAGGLYAEDPRLARQAMNRVLFPRGFVPTATTAAAIPYIPIGIAGGLSAAMVDAAQQGFPTTRGNPEFATEPTPQQLLFDEQRRRRLITEMPREDRLRRFGTVDVEQALRGGAFAAPAAATTPTAVLPTATTPGAQPGAQPGTPPAPRREPGPRREPDPGAAGAQTPTLLGGPGTTEQTQAGIAGLASTPSTLRQEFAAFMPEGGTSLADIERQTGEVGAAGIAAAKAAKDLREKQLAEMGLFGVDQERRLGERRGRIEKQEKELGGLSLLQAGLAMMSGTSPNALQNIGIGAQAGLKTYGEGIDKLENAREKLDDAYGRLEAARRSERILTDKERADLAANVSKAEIEAKKLTLDGARQAYGLNQQLAGKMFDAFSAEKRLGAELGSRERLTREQMQSQEKIAAGRNAMMDKLYGGDVRARQEFARVQQNVMASLSKNPLYTNETDENKKTALYNTELRRALQASPFLSAYAAGIGFTRAPAGGKVHDLTE